MCTLYIVFPVILWPEDGPQLPKHVIIINLVKFSRVLTCPPLPNLTSEISLMRFVSQAHTDVLNTAANIKSLKYDEGFMYHRGKWAQGNNTRTVELWPNWLMDVRRKASQEGEPLLLTNTMLTHWGRVTQICVFNTRLFSLHNTLNNAIHRACLRMVLLTDVYRNLTSLWIKL